MYITEIFYTLTICFESAVSVGKHSILAEWKRLFPAEPQNPALPEWKDSGELFNFLKTSTV